MLFYMVAYDLRKRKSFTSTLALRGGTLQCRFPNDLNPSTASWVPNPSRIESSGMAKFCLAAEQRWGRSFDSYDALHKWSIEHLDEFWMSVWDFLRCRGGTARRQSQR